MVVIIAVFSLFAHGNESKKESVIELNNDGQEFVQKLNTQIKHPKRKIITGKLVTRDDYVKTSNPKRLHWNKIHEKNSPEINNVINSCPKRRNLVRLLSLEKKAGNPSNSFHKAKRHRHDLSK